MNFGLTPEEFMQSMHEPNLMFLRDKGRDVDTLAGLYVTREWLKTAPTLAMFYGNEQGQPDDAEIMIGELRRVMLIETVEQEILRQESNSGYTPAQ